MLALHCAGMRKLSPFPLKAALAAIAIMLAGFMPAAARADDGAARFLPSAQAYESLAIARFGPFQVVDASRAALVDVTDEQSPAQFAAMMRAYPQIRTLALVECPGTYEDRANLRLGRMIRAAGLAVHVPAGGSVRSGGVELVFAGQELRIDDGAEFAVHAWEDEDGLQATDYAANAPENTKYLAYYREMGLSPDQARAFYAMTNSVPFEQARWFGAVEMRRWLGLSNGTPVPPSRLADIESSAPVQAGAAPPKLAYAGMDGLDLASALN